MSLSPNFGQPIISHIALQADSFSTWGISRDPPDSPPAQDDIASISPVSSRQLLPISFPNLYDSEVTSLELQEESKSAITTNRATIEVLKDFLDKIAPQLFFINTSLTLSECLETEID